MNDARRDLLNSSIKKNRLVFGSKGPLRPADIKYERECNERHEMTASLISGRMKKTMEGLEPLIVTYKMTHSEIANKARKVAHEGKQRIKDLAVLAYITRLD
jgi:hypothetical protein